MRSLLAVFAIAMSCALPLASGSDEPMSQTKPTTPAASPAAKPAARSRSCDATYRRLFGKGSASFRVVFGYKDARPARFVGDRHERLAFVQRIVKPCEGARQDCGFMRDEDNADLFSKTINEPDGKPVKIALVVAASSVGSDDEANREDALQEWQSAYVERLFLGGIEKADVVFYNGHSRFGGGPDFEAPRLTAESSVDVSFYQGRRPGFQKILEKLRERAKRDKDHAGPQVLGLFSCASSQHFSEAIAKESKTALISSRALIYYADALENSLAALSALLEMKCEREFRGAIREAYPVSGSHVEGLF